jgi:PAS domain-containing protein
MKKKRIIIDENGQDLDRLSRLLRENGFCATETVTDAEAPEGMGHSSAQVYMNLFENAPIGIFRTTPEGEILSFNAAGARLLKYDSSNELIREVYTCRS